MRVFFFLLILLSFPALGKSFEQYGAVPFLSVGKKFSEKYDLNFYHSDTFVFRDKTFQGKEYPSRDSQAYFQTSLSYRLLPAFSLTLGHIYQRNNPLDVDFANEHRIFEQVTYAHTKDATTFTHRLRFEQRFIDGRHSHDFKTRLRYQIGATFPLNGRQLDPGEWYFNSYNEFYFSSTGERNSFYSDDWAYAGFGYQTETMGKFEAGPLAQFGTVNRDKDIRSFYALQLGWIVKF